MPKAKAGYVERRIALDTQDVCLSNARRIAAAIDDLLDGDGDFRRALAELNELGLTQVELFAIQSKIADGDLQAAEEAAQNLAAQKKK